MNKSTFSGKNIAILGGTGTVGRALVHYLSTQSTYVSKVLIFSRDEIKQLEMMEDFPEGGNPRIEYRLGDVRDQGRLNEVLQGYDYVVHAAAIKHVVMAEKNPSECRKTNVSGAQNVIRACLQNHVEQAVLISSDKAYNPIGVYGKSKLEAEGYWLGANGMTKFNVVRLGNIVGARGSVFEIFKKQRKTGVLKVTHPDATRFCISQPEAAEFIFNALHGEGGDISIPTMNSFRVMDLAREIAPECEIEIVGLRPGDKLHEELDGEGDSLQCLQAMNNV